MQQPEGFSLYGAVDLGARQAATQRRQQAGESSAAGGQAGTGAGPIIDVTDETFSTEVVARSREVPVIVDLWADWCGPCKQLGPVLEKLATEAAGAWVLARVDVDANPQIVAWLAQAGLPVQSIPMVLAMIGGQLAPLFLGAQPESAVRAYLDEVQRAAEQLGLQPGGGQDGGEQAGAAGQPGAQGPTAGTDPGSVPPGVSAAEAGAAAGGADALAESALTEAQAAMQRGDLDGAAAAFEKLLDALPGHPLATMGLGQVDLFRRVSSYDDAKARREAAERPNDAEAQAKVADIDLVAGRVDDSFDRLLGTIKRTSGEERDKARMHLLSLFEIFPPRDPQVAKARSRLSSLLF
jgi:putative thioredoxin